MDIAGAKALRQRLGSNGADHVPLSSVDVAEDAPPLYHWLGVRHIYRTLRRRRTPLIGRVPANRCTADSGSVKSSLRSAEAG